MNIRTGEALPDLGFTDLEDELDDDDAADEWLHVSAFESRAAYRHMERFIADVVPSALTDKLTAAITGKGAFSRFRACIEDWPDLAGTWRLYSE